MSSLILILITGVGLGALYFLVASGLSLIYGLMHVLNFAHGAFLTAGAYAAWVAMAYLSGLGGWSFPVAVVIGMVVGALIGAAVEFFLIRPLVPPAHRAGAGHRRPRADGGRAVHRHLGAGPAAVPPPGLDHPDHRRSAGRPFPTIVSC